VNCKSSRLLGSLQSPHVARKFFCVASFCYFSIVQIRCTICGTYETQDLLPYEINSCVYPVDLCWILNGLHCWLDMSHVMLQGQLLLSGDTSSHLVTQSRNIAKNTFTCAAFVNIDRTELKACLIPLTSRSRAT